MENQYFHWTTGTVHPTNYSVSNKSFATVVDLNAHYGASEDAYSAFAQWVSVVWPTVSIHDRQSSPADGLRIIAKFLFFLLFFASDDLAYTRDCVEVWDESLAKIILKSEKIGKNQFTCM